MLRKKKYFFCLLQFEIKRLKTYIVSFFIIFILLEMTIFRESRSSLGLPGNTKSNYPKLNEKR